MDTLINECVFKCCSPQNFFSAVFHYSRLLNKNEKFRRTKFASNAEYI